MKIYKYILAIVDKQQLALPSGAQVLSVQVQHGELVLWALVNTSNRPKPRAFYIFGTGNPIPDDAIGPFTKHLASVQMGSLVWHVFTEVDDA